VTLVHGFSPDGHDGSVAQINSQTLFRPLLHNHATVPGQERFGRSEKTASRPSLTHTSFRTILQ